MLKKYISGKNLVFISRFAAVTLFILSILAGVQLLHIRFDYKLDNYFPKDDVDFTFYNDYVNKLEDDFNIVLVGIKAKKTILDSNFIARVNTLEAQLQELEAVNRIYNPFKNEKLIIGPFGPILLPYFHPEQPERYASDSLAVVQSELIGNLISEDFSAVNLLLRHDKNLGKTVEDQLAEDIKSIAASTGFHELYISGRIIGQAYYTRLMQKQFIIFTGLGFLLLTALLLYFYRSVTGLLIPLSIVVLSNILLLAGVLALKGGLSILMTIVPTIIFIVGVSDIVHLFSTYSHELDKQQSSANVLWNTLKKVGIPTLLTSLTTAFGFITLIPAKIAPVADFGWITAVGILIAFLVTYLIFIFFHLNHQRFIRIKTRGRLNWTALMSRIFSFSFRNQKAILAGSGFIFLIGLIGMWQLKADNYILEDLSKNDTHRLSFEFLENNFSGVKPFEVAVQSKTGEAIDIFNLNQLKELDQIEHFLQDSLELPSILSPVLVIKMMNRSFNGGQEKYFRVPGSEKEMQRLARYKKVVERQLSRNKLFSEDKQLTRVTGRTKDVGGKAMRGKYDRFNRYVATRNFQYIDAQFTGLGYLIDKTNHELVYNLLFGLGVAVVVVALIIGLMFMSVRITIVSLAVNLFPLVFIGGLMGFLGIPLNLSTAIIFSIAFGIAVDDSIHFLGKYRLERLEKKPILFAIKNTYMSSGKAIIITSIVILSGFFSLWFAQFNSIYYMGLLVSITLFVAVLADLFLLPLLIVMAEKR